MAQKLGELIDKISIHALREEGDTARPSKATATSNFYPHPPRGGRPLAISFKVSRVSDFYPRPPRGGRRTFHV